MRRPGRFRSSLGRSAGLAGLSPVVTEIRDSSVPSARQRLRDVYDRQAAALARFAALEAKAAKLRRAMAGVELEQLAALGELADVAGAELAAELTGVSTSTAREAMAARRRRAAGDTAAPAPADGARPAR